MKKIIVSCSIGVLSLAYSPFSQANWLDWWQTKNQQGYHSWQQGKMKEASELFEHPQWKASAQYRAGNYEQAAKLFAQQGNYYNQGNALAHLGQLDQAIAAYKKTLKSHPNHVDAKHNLALLEQLKKQEQQQQQNQQNQSQQGDSQQNESSQQQNQSNQAQDQGQQNQSNQDSQQTQENSPNNQSATSTEESSLEGDESHLQNATNEEERAKQQQNNTQNQQQENAESGQNNQQEDGNLDSEKQRSAQAQQEKKNQDSQMQTQQLTQEEIKALENDLNFKQWLRSLPNHQDSLLKRKFAYQYQKRQSRQTPQAKKNKEKVW